MPEKDKSHALNDEVVDYQAFVKEKMKNAKEIFLKPKPKVE